MDRNEKKLANGIVYYTCDVLQFGDYDNSCAVERANVRYLKEHEELKDSIESFSFSDWDKGYTYVYRGIQNDSELPPIDSNEKLVETIGGYNSRQLWVRSDIWDEHELDMLHDYPSIDDELVSIIEMEMEDEAWESYVKSDLIKTLPDELDDEYLNEGNCRCLNCNWEGKVKQLIKDDFIYDILCPECNNPYSIKFYPIETKTLNEFADELDNDTIYEIYRDCCEITNTYGYCESGGNWYIDIDSLKETFKQRIQLLYNGLIKCDHCTGSGKRYTQSHIFETCEKCKGIGFVEMEDDNE
jgi:hypothetical protein